MRKVKVRTSELGDIYLDLHDLVPMELVYVIESYTIEKIDERFVLTFFDKNNNIINVEVTDEVF